MIFQTIRKEGSRVIIVVVSVVFIVVVFVVTSFGCR